jgi:glucose repression regulatory protein TUP1
MYGNHRGLGPAPGSSNARLNELLDGIRAEFDNQARASGEYEHSSKRSQLAELQNWDQQPSSKRLLTTSTVTQQINEMQMVREKVFAMEQTHLALKQK